MVQTCMYFSCFLAIVSKHLRDDSAPVSYCTATLFYSTTFSPPHLPLAQHSSLNKTMQLLIQVLRSVDGCGASLTKCRVSEHFLGLLVKILMPEAFWEAKPVWQECDGLVCQAVHK